MKRNLKRLLYTLVSNLLILEKRTYKRDKFNENMSSYFTKLMRVPNHQSHYEQQPKPRSRSLDVEALERSGIKMLRVVIPSYNYANSIKQFINLNLFLLLFFVESCTATSAAIGSTK